MPELPEVETTRRSVAPILSGRRIVHVTVARDRMVRRQDNPGDFRARLEGATVVTVTRHGKFLLAGLDNDVVWVTHLGMSGRVAVTRSGAPTAPHTHVVVTLDSGYDFRLVDPRTFGFVVAYTPEEYADSTLAALGRDALTDLPRSPALGRLLAGRKAPVKPLLLDQGIVAGIGNIYADESLHRAAIAPHRPGGSLDTAELKALRRGIKETLAAALRWGGTSLDDLAYLLPDGRAGDFVSRLRVYGREGEPCRRCGGVVVRDVLRGRSTFWCPRCQR
jgi:formamidopyrimidine-DNA glycosylase